MLCKNKPNCYIIGGPNGAGKTTFAMRHLPRMTGCSNFVNADMIAKGLSPLNPDKAQLAAGRVFLTEIRKHIAEKKDFAFETTLSGRGYVKLLKQLRAESWRIVLYYLWIPSAEFSKERVRERVAHGGHDIPDEAIVRRYPRTTKNLFELYAPLCDELFFYDNSAPEPELLFEETQDGRQIFKERRFKEIQKGSQS
jgi:predicted ABC-type ATPase